MARPEGANRGYLVVRRDAEVTGIAVKTQASCAPRRGAGLCDLCNTAHHVTDVALFAARGRERARDEREERGRQGADRRGE